MKDNQIAELLEKYKTGRLTPKEKTVLENWYLHQAAPTSDYPPGSAVETLGGRNQSSPDQIPDGTIALWAFELQVTSWGGEHNRMGKSPPKIDF
jgi:hypothetical protein